MKKWITILVVVLLLGGGYVFATRTTLGKRLLGRVTGSRQASTLPSSTAVATGANGSTTGTVQVQPASAIVKEVSASGHIELTDQNNVALAVDGTISKVNVNIGDVVKAGQVLVSLDTTDLERALARAQIAVDTANNKLAQTKKPATATALAAAEAKLASAKASLLDAKTPPSAEELTAAQASVTAAQAKYSDLAKGPTQDKLTQLQADIKKKQVALAEAQRAYDKVKWRNDVGMTQESADLQSASIDYESAKAAYQESIAPASTADLQSALSEIKTAQKNLADIKKKPNVADIATAEANVADAQSSLDTLKEGADALDVKADQLSLQSALVDLEEARNNLAQAKVTAPISGTILSVNAEVGQHASKGTVIVTMSDPTKLKLTINVAEVDVSQIKANQPAEVTIDAFPGKSFVGKVAYVAPSSSSTSGLIEYPVTVVLTGDNLANVRPGMTSVASIADTNSAIADGWFVPSNAIKQQNRDKVVTVMRDDTATDVKVTQTGTIQGEWTLVKSADLKEGDQVVGSVATKISNNQGGFGPGGGGPPPGAGGGGNNNNNNRRTQN